MLQLRRFAGVVSLFAAVALTGRVVTAAPTVVVSIQPIHSLVAAVMEGVAVPALLIRGAASEHSFTLRPSDARLLQRADLVFWVGEDLESYLRKPLRSVATRARIIAVAEQGGIALLPNREGGAWKPGAAKTAASGHAHAGDAHRHGEHDMHVWLDPENAQRIVATASAALGRADAANAPRYAGNAARAAAQLAALDRELGDLLAPVRAVPFIVFHDAYQYLERRYGLNAVGAVMLGPERQPGARRLYEVRERIEATGARCVFSEPQYDAALVQTVVSGTSARSSQLDPLGAGLDPGAELYFALLRRLATTLRDCLARSP